MCEGQIHSFNSGIEWRSRGESMRLNTEKACRKCYMVIGSRLIAASIVRRSLYLMNDLLIVMQDIVLQGSTGSKVKIKE